MEIEFKYLVKNLPKDYKSYSQAEIIQTYLKMKDEDDGNTYRIRKMNDKYFYCVKGSGLVSREEFEKEISKDEYDSLMAQKIDNTISKTRYFIPLGYDDLIAELDFIEPKKVNQNAIFNGMTFVITGALNNFTNRDEAKSLIESLGGKVSGSVSNKTNYLVNNDITSTSGKNKKAKELNIPIITEDELLQMIYK